jgi:hypothetical protein
MTQETSKDAVWVEPDSQAEFSKYPYNNIKQTESGHSMEFDDTPGYERIRLQHRTGSFTEIQSDGTEIHKIIGDGYEIVSRNNHVLIKGFCTVTIQGDSILSVKGDVYQQVEGDVNQLIQGDMNTTVKGDATIVSEGDVNIAAGGSSGQVNLSAPFGVHINSDLTVGGSISSTGAIFSDENVLAAKKVYAVEGLTTIGGIQCGIPDFGPLIPGVITSSVSVNTPVVNALTLNDVIGPVLFMRYLYDIHIHPTPEGPSGTPSNSQLGG